jgi:flagellar motility protein MotE (MotC chaperone)
MAYDRGGKTVRNTIDGDADALGVKPAAATTRADATTGPKPASAPPKRAKVPFMAQLRVLPVMIFLATLLLSFKVTAIWDALHDETGMISLATYAEAQQTPARAQAAGQTQAAATEVPATKAAATEVPATKVSTPKPVQLAQASGGTQGGGEKPLDPVLFTRSEIELLQELSKRRKELDAREQTVIQREGLLNAAETRIEKKIAELKGVKDDIEKLIQQYEEQEEQQLNDLVAIYEKMKPKDASRIFNDLETDILLQIFDKMKASKTALILANMKAARAKEITSRIAERREMPNIN